jgi:hypothetical protein
VRIIQSHKIVSSRHLEGPLAFSVRIDLSVENQGIDDGTRVAQRLNAVANRLVMKDGEVIGSVVGDNWQPLGEIPVERRVDLSDHFTSWPTIALGNLGSDAVDRGRLIRNNDTRVSKPGMSLYGLSLGPDHSHVRRDNTGVTGVQTRGFGIKNC